ncbi:DMP19 family protein [Sphingobacterium yanglingense]|uniref:Uncharacterized protein DUF4375 n=1 Tax=Sphingobacterium yanglingense TaxID=1437280 RepID=A0A4R6WEP1_9SPHI|nr:DUF4375 domain-containing protein [Sphingobacterium yanglingense]TDQ78272.1 uncharacterized protein DUF4375 [Sphingobacterium yanglingense]
MKNLDNEWFDFTIKYVDKLNDNDGNWDALSEEEQELAALWRLEADMYNGGFLQFFCNWGPLCFEYAIRALTKLQAEECLAILQQQCGIIMRLENNKEIKALWDIPKFLTEDELNEISDVLDLKYWDNQDDIVSKTLHTYSVLYEASIADG